MSSQHDQDTISDLLHEVTDVVEPGDRLDAIRAATADRGRRTRSSRWVAAGGAGLVAASVVTALALSTGAGPRGSEPGPAEGSTTLIDPGPRTQAVAVYFQGDTPRGPRLYREFRRIRSDDPLVAALRLVFEGSPLDPDYRTGWPPVRDPFVDAEVVDDVIRVEISDPELLIEHDPPVEQNALAIEQVIYTAQAAVQERLPVQFVHDGNPISELFGRPAGEPLANGPALDVLAHASLSEPSEGSRIRVGEAIPVVGVGRSQDGRASLRITRAEDQEVVAYLEPDLEPKDAPLAPFSVRLLRDDLQPGDYVVAVTVTNTDGTLDTDTRRITIVD